MYIVKNKSIAILKLFRLKIHKNRIINFLFSLLAFWFPVITIYSRRYKYYDFYAAYIRLYGFAMYYDCYRASYKINEIITNWIKSIIIKIGNKYPTCETGKCIYFLNWNFIWGNFLILLYSVVMICLKKKIFNPAL